MSNQPRCEWEGCKVADTKLLTACYLDDGEAGIGGPPDHYYCAKHAPLAGFCYLCGCFWGGIDGFDFGPGYCEFCASEVEEYEDPEDEKYWEPPY